jgi:hypothetical protein
MRGLAYIAMELVVGKPLRAFVGDRAIAMEERVRWLRDVALALAAAHDAGIVHRDVKPENVMIRDDGAVKVLDFGIARRAPRTPPPSTTPVGQSVSLRRSDPPVSGLSATLTAHQVAIGTPMYMSPEQLRAEAIDGRADQFGWGVMAYELLAGQLPWECADAIALLSTILSRDPRSPAALEPAIPGPLAATILRTLAKSPDARFASMHDVVRAIDGRAPASTKPSPAAAPSPLSQTGGAPVAPRAAPAPRRRAVLGVTGLAAMGLAAACVALARTAPDAPAPHPAAAPAACTSSAACAREHGGAPWRCNAARRVCVEIASPDCRVGVAPGDVERDDTVWLGGLYPLTGDDARDMISETRAFELARRDFADAFRANAPRGDLHARRVATVTCDEAKDPARAVRHLVEDVEVPAVVGFRWPASALETVPSVLLPAHALAMVSMSQDPALTRIPEPKGEPRLVWRTTLDSSRVAAPIARLIEYELEPGMRAGRKAGFQMRVAVLRGGSRAGYLDDLFRTLRFNGATALENGDDFRQYVIDPAGGDGGVAKVLSDLAAFAPNVVVVQGVSDFASSLVAPLEAQWDGPDRPTYVTAMAFGDGLAAFAGRDASRRRRFLGVTNVSSTMPNAQLVLHYNSVFPGEPVLRTDAPQPSYDAFYMLAYAALSLPADAPVTGPALSRAFARLGHGGKRVDVGPAGIFDAFEALRSGGDVDLEGAIGSLDFDPATGEAPIDYAVLCPGVDDHGVAAGFVESGLVFDAGKKAFRGQLRCP